MKRAMIILLAGALLLPAGCRPPWLRGPDAALQEKVASEPPNPELQRLRAENETLKSEVAELQLRLEDVGRRESALADRCQRAEFMSERYQAQVKTIAPAIKERDAALAENDRLKGQVAQLQEQVAELRRLLARMDGTPEKPEAQTESSSSDTPRQD